MPTLIDQAFLTDSRAGGVSPQRIVVCTHAKFSSSELCRVLRQAGHEVFFYPVDYSREEAHVEAMAAMGVHILDRPEEILAALAGADGVIEDGARVSKLIAEHRPDLKDGFFSVEQTSGGIRYFAEHPPTYPVINVAMSAMKLDLENRRATPEGVVEQFSRATGKTLAGRNVLVIGFGSIGEGLARLIRVLGGHVTVTDRSATRQLFATHRGYAIVSPEALDYALPSQDVVFMATNAYQGSALGVEQVLLMRDGAIICNAGSGHGEFAARLQAIGSVAFHDAEITVEARDGNLAVRCSKHGLEKEILVLAEAYPINLHFGPGTSHDVIEFVMALLLLAFFHGPDGSSPGVQPLDPDIQERLAKTALALHGPKQAMEPRFIKTRDLPAGERPYGWVAPFHTDLNDRARFSVARASFRPGSKTRGHYHLRSQEAYVAERGTARIEVWHADRPEDRTVHTLEPGDYLLIPEKHFHDVRVPGTEDFECLVIADPPFQLWDQFFQPEKPV